MSIKIIHESEYSHLLERDGYLARVIGTKSLLDQAMKTEAVNQLMNMSEMPGIMGYATALPDIHQGYGFPIGSVIAFDAENGIISPGGVGYDINCGVALMNTGVDVKTFKKYTGQLLEELFQAIPVGMSRSRNKLTKSDMDRIATEGIQWLYQRDIATEDDINRTDYNGTMFGAETQNISEKAFSRGMNFFGTLGSGNHFLEIQYAEKVFNRSVGEEFGIHEGMVYVMLHTGSRGFGHQVATDYMQEIRGLDHNRKLKDLQLSYMEIGSKVGDRYISAMNGAANYAFANRQFILYLVRQSLKKVLGNEFVEEDSELVYNISHNMATFEEHTIHGRNRKVLVHRKGATRALPPDDTRGFYAGVGHPVLVPGSMGTSSYVLRGKKGNSEISFSTSCHGAGRIMGRKSANDSLNPEDIREEMDRIGVQMKIGSPNAITEEAPESYKSIDEVYDSIIGSGIAEGISRMKPIGVIKG